MKANRRARLQSVILEEISTLVAREVKDPRIPRVTFTSVEVTPDGGQATIFVSIFGGSGGDARIDDCLAGLESASGFLRRNLAKALNIRHVPSLVFREDKGFENTLRVHELLKTIKDET